MKTTVKLTANLRMAFLEAARVELGQRGKSRWVCAALEELERDDRGLASVGLGEDAFVPECSVQVALGPEDEERLRRLVEHVRRQDPLAEGVQSQILRAAIRWKLVRSRGPARLEARQLSVKKGKIGGDGFEKSPAKGKRRTMRSSSVRLRPPKAADKGS
ncbi:MAG: hypothetical protein P8Y25_01125 [Chromatiaceae bacterium]